MRFLFFLIFPIFCFSQEDNFEKLNKLPKYQFEKAVKDSIFKLQSGDLWNFLKVLNDDYKTDLKVFNNDFIKKIEITNWPMDMHFLLNVLLEQETEVVVIEKVLNERKEIWDKGEWSKKFWKIIREKQLKVDEQKYYSIDDKGQKVYHIKFFLEEQMKNNIIGENPLLQLNYQIENFESGKLLETLEKLSIKDIQIISKEKATKLYGKRGVDGMIKVLTN